MQNNELKKIYWNDIIDSPLFTAIAPEHIEDMIDYLDGTIKKYKKNETIIHVGDEFRRCGILLDGSQTGLKNTMLIIFIPDRFLENHWP